MKTLFEGGDHLDIKKSSIVVIYQPDRINSDPAGEEDFIDKNYQEITRRLRELFIEYRVTKHPNDFTVEAMRLIEAYYVPNKLFFKQTGRTYTEAEVEQIAKDYVFNICDIVDGEEIAVYKYKREGDLGVRAAVDVWKIMNNIPLTKQNLKL